MNIQIDSVGFVNRGAELMLHAILEKVKQQYPSANFVWGNNDKNCTFGDISGLGIYQIFELEKFKIPLHKMAHTLHADIKRYGLVYQNDVDVLFDAGGFRFGDHLARKARHLKKIDTYYHKLKRKGIKIIFLPQAFGPFNKRISLSIIRSVASYADLIVARDQESYNYLISALGESEKMKLFPDFTNLVSGRISNEIYQAVSGRVCIIPNSKMVTHTSPRISQNYINFVKKVFLEAKANGKEVTLLNHAGEKDDKICEEIKDQLDSGVELCSRPNALEAKGIIGASSLVISSRFHGVASALSQAVPCLVSGWSHKYLMLLKDYDLENGILDLNDESAALNKVSEFIDENVNTQLRDHLAKKSKALKKKSEEMWNSVFKIIDGTKP